jgi:hypothetical protein
MFYEYIYKTYDFAGLFCQRPRHMRYDTSKFSLPFYSTRKTFGPLLLVVFFFLFPLSNDAAAA